jgi:hypothetical protein
MADCLVTTASIKLFELPALLDKKHWLSEVFIQKNLRRQEIGSALIADCIKISFNLGTPTLYFTHQTNRDRTKSLDGKKLYKL